MLILIVTIFLAVFGVGIYCAVRYVRCSASSPSELVSDTNRYIRSSQPDVIGSESLVCSVDEVKITRGTDTEATAGMEVNGVKEAVMMDMLPTPVRKAYLNFGHSNSPSTPTSEDTSSCSITPPSGIDRPPTPAPFYRTHAYGQPNVYHSTQTPNEVFNTASFPSPSCASLESSLPATSPSSDSSSLRPSSELSLESTPHGPVLQVRNTLSPPCVSSSSSTASHSSIDSVVGRTQGSPTPVSKERRYNTAVGIKPLRLVQKLDSQPLQDNYTGRNITDPFFIDANTQRNTYTHHDTTVSRVVKIGGGRRHRDARPVTLGY
jgi:hypothetical protein